MENGKFKVLWDFTVQTDRETCGRRRDIIMFQKDKIFCQISDFASPYDEIVDTRELERPIKTWHKS